MNKVNAWLIGSASAALLTAASVWEGTRYTPYDDIAGVLTVCQGHTGPDIVRTKRYTPAECAQYLKDELGTHGAGVLKCTHVPLSRNQYEAFTLFAYNVGTAAFCSSSLLKKLNAGDYVGACHGLMAWNKARVNGVLTAVNGLTRRRAFERDMCLRGAT